MISEFELKDEILEIGKRLYAKGLLASTDGSITMKINDNEYFCTATGTNKGFMSVESICKVDAEGKVLRANTGFRPSSAVITHMLIHKERPEMKAVIHAYPINATFFANAGIPLTQPATLEAVNSIGCVPYVEKGLAKSEEELLKLTEAIRYFDAVLLGDMGVLTFGTTLEAAFNKMESVELYANLIAKSYETGIGKDLTECQEKDLFSKKDKFGFTKKHPSNICIRNKAGKPGCYSCCNHANVAEKNEALVMEVRKKVMEQLKL